MRSAIPLAVLAATLGSAGCCDCPDEPACMPGEMRMLEDACGVCGTGTATQECSADRAWEIVQCLSDIDADDDGWPGDACDALPGGCCTTQRDCDDTDRDVHPGATERCNGTDDDCDGETDEGCP